MNYGLHQSWSTHIKIFRKVSWAEIRVRLGLQLELQSQAWILFAVGFSVRACNTQMGISGASDIRIRWFKSPNSSTLPGIQLGWGSKSKRDRFNTVILMQAGRRDLFLIWWETDLMGSPMLIRKSDGIGEILFTESNLLYFSQSLLSLRLLSRG